MRRQRNALAEAAAGPSGNMRTMKSRSARGIARYGERAMLTSAPSAGGNTTWRRHPHGSTAALGGHAGVRRLNRSKNASLPTGVSHLFFDAFHHARLNGKRRMERFVQERCQPCPIRHQHANRDRHYLDQSWWHPDIAVEMSEQQNDFRRQPATDQCGKHDLEKGAKETLDEMYDQQHGLRSSP